jgi:hypothetical protein
VKDLFDRIPEILSPLCKNSSVIPDLESEEETL